MPKKKLARASRGRPTTCAQADATSSEQQQQEEDQSRARSPTPPPPRSQRCSRGRTPPPSTSLQSEPPEPDDEPASLPASQPEDSAKGRREPKKSFTLNAEQEREMVEWLEENQFLWDIKQTNYRRRDLKEARWQEMGEKLGVSAEYLKGWWAAIRDQWTRFHHPKSGQGAAVFTERQQWIISSFDFLKRVVRHRGESVRPIRPEPADPLELADQQSQQQGIEEAAVEESQPGTSSQPVSNSSRPSKHPRTPVSSVPSNLSESIANSEQMLRTLVERAVGPPSHSKREGFASYVYKALLRMPARQYRELKPVLFQQINACLGDSEDEDDSVPLPTKESTAEEEATGDDQCPPSKRHRSQWQPHPSQWHPHPPQGTSVHGSMDAGYMARYWSAFPHGTTQQASMYSQYPGGSMHQPYLPPLTPTTTRSPKRTPRPSTPVSPLRRSPRRSGPLVSQVLGSTREALQDMSLANLSGLSGLEIGSSTPQEGQRDNSDRSLHTPQLLNIDEQS